MTNDESTQKMRKREPEEIAIKILGALWLIEGVWSIVLGVMIVSFSVIQGLVFGALGYLLAFRTSSITRRVMPTTRFRRWIFRFPALVGISYLILSLPFILGFLRISIHEGSILGVIYVLINLLPIAVFSQLIDNISQRMFVLPTLEHENILFILASLVFWVVPAFCLGAIADIKNIICSRRMRDENI